MKRRSTASLLGLLASVTLGLTASLSASTVFWESTVGSVMVTSTGAPLDGYFSFEMGTFNSGFTPTWENFAQWESNWNVIDRVYDPTPENPNDGDPQGWNTLDRFYAATVQLEPTGESNSPEANPTHQFLMGEQVYLWVFNDKAQVPGTEWALMRLLNGRSQI
jgi:hypothetical protein